MKTLVTCAVLACVCCLSQNTAEVQPQTQMMVMKTTAEAAAAGAAMTGPVTYFSFELGEHGGPVKNAPFSADVTNDHVQTLADGNHIRTSNPGKIFRDSAGRTRRETMLNLVGPWSTAGEKQTHVLINDPVAGVAYDLDEEQKTARKLPPAQFKVPTGGGIGLSMGPQDVVRLKQKLAAESGSGNARTEDLGTQNIEGVPAHGTRTTITIPAGAMGNEAPIQTASERWYSPDLQTVVLATVHDPRMGDSTYKLTNIVLAEPAESLFEVPAGFQVVEPKNFFYKTPTK
ncbi:MAG TPA: hypothetical protein VFA04_04270 [Bryobacteraceae bacterium]|nr:hypothetical protein [Bryobacteraceae bacterium]